MQKYENTSGDSGVSHYEVGENYILVRFVRGGIYKYSYAATGNGHVERMKKLAVSGKGLATYINQYVRDKYER